MKKLGLGIAIVVLLAVFLAVREAKAQWVPNNCWRQETWSYAPDVFTASVSKLHKTPSGEPANGCGAIAVVDGKMLGKFDLGSYCWETYGTCITNVRQRQNTDGDHRFKYITTVSVKGHHLDRLAIWNKSPGKP